MEQDWEPEGAVVFDYHAVPPLSVIRIRARIRAVYVGLPMPYDVTCGEEEGDAVMIYGRC